MTMKRFVLGAVALAVCTGISSARIRLPEIIGNDMVLKQNDDVRVWGFAGAGSRIVVSPDWSDSTFSAVCDSEGKWTAVIDTPSGGMDIHEIRITETEPRSGKVSDSITLCNILIGEVWFCSGQSNMEMPLDGFWDCPVEGSAEEIALSGRHDGSGLVSTGSAKIHFGTANDSAEDYFMWIWAEWIPSGSSSAVFSRRRSLTGRRTHPLPS